MNKSYLKKIIKKYHLQSKHLLLDNHTLITSTKEALYLDSYMIKLYYNTQQSGLYIYLESKKYIPEILQPFRYQKKLKHLLK